MLVTSGKFSQALFDKNIKAFVIKGMNKLAAEADYYKRFAYNEQTDEEMFSMLDGVERGEFVEIGENSKIPEETDLPGFKTTYSMKDFGRTKYISYVAGRADASSHKQLSEARLTASLGRSYIKKLNNTLADTIKRGFDTAYTSYGDNKPFFSTSHTRIDGGSTTYRSNASSTGLVLNYENLKTLKRQLRRVVDGNGEVIDYTEKKIELVVPTALVDTAYEAIGTGAYAPDGADYKPGRNLDVEVAVFPLLGAESKGALGSDIAWYLKIKDLGDEESIKIYHREGLAIASERDFDTRKMKVQGVAAWATGWSDPVGKWVGSKGDGNAYAS